MARDFEKQHLFQENGYAIDCGYIAFSGTSAEVDIYTPLSKIFHAEFTPVASASDTMPGSERLWLDESGMVNSVDGALDLGTSHAVTLRREGEPFAAGQTLDVDMFSSNNLIECVLFTAPFALTLSKVVWVNSVQWGGSPVLNLGTSEDGDPDDNVDAQAITTTARATTTITTFASTSVAANADVRASSTGGATSTPIGSCVTAIGNRALTSGLGVFYKLIGRD